MYGTVYQRVDHFFKGNKSAEHELSAGTRRSEHQLRRRAGEKEDSMNKRPNATQLRRDPLVLASLAFLAANLLHGFDHLRTGTERLTAEVSLGGFLITIAALAMVYLALRGFPRAPLIAILIGSWSGVLIASAHFAPQWSALSDSYWDLKPDAFSWAVAAAEVTAALGLFLVGLSTIRRQAAGPANSISMKPST
jgi:hypothetical protein